MTSVPLRTRCGLTSVEANISILPTGASIRRDTPRITRTFLDALRKRGILPRPPARHGVYSRSSGVVAAVTSSRPPADRCLCSANTLFRPPWSRRRCGGVDNRQLPAAQVGVLHGRLQNGCLFLGTESIPRSVTVWFVSKLSLSLPCAPPIVRALGNAQLSHHLTPGAW